MLTWFYILVVEQILQGIYSLWEGTRWLRWVRQRLSRPAGLYEPRVALLCPVKGLEPGLEHNLMALTEFDYAPYELFFTLANSADPAADVVRRVAAAGKHPAHVVVAGPPQDCGEKVHNLRTAILQAGDQFEVFVFTDSDGRVSRGWLRRLVAPLAESRVGAASTFRWYFPSRGGFWSALASAWNAPVATYLGDHKRNFCWGGGTAIRREVFETIRALDYWEGSVSDDYSLTRAIRNYGLDIRFVPECLVPTPFDVNFGELLEFTNRQIIITRVYAPRLWLLWGLGHLLYCGALFTGIVGLLSNWLTGATGLHILLLLLTPPVLSAARGAQRLAAITDLLPSWRQKLLEYGWVWTLVAPLVPLLGLWNALVAGVTRRIDWRGIHYKLISPNQTRLLSR